MKTIVVTGASSGIGWDTVRVLSQSGYRVLATVRRPADADRLKSQFATVIPLLVDLSQWGDIESLPQILRDQYQIEQIDGLVNNAGVALAGPFLDQDFKEIETVIQVNVLAVMKMTQVLLPMLGAKAHSAHAGKIINISSISGISGAPFLSAYAASKHAIEGFSDALRKELMLFGIPVVVIGPGSIKTPIWQKGFQTIQKRYEKSLYADPFQKFIGFAADEEKNALEVTRVSELIAQILENPSPRFRYAPIPRPFRNSILPMFMTKRFFTYLTAKTFGLLKS